MKVKPVDTTVNLILNIDNEMYMGKRDNFAIVTEDDALTDGSIQRIFFPEGRPIKSFIMNKTNKVISIDDISGGFTGFHDRTGTLVGSKQFQLTTGGRPAFKKTYDASSSSIVNTDLNTISIQNHDFQTGQTVTLDTQGGSKIGIAITSYTTGTKDIVWAQLHLVLVEAQCLRMDLTFRFRSRYRNCYTESTEPQFVLYGFGNPDGGV